MGDVDTWAAGFSALAAGGSLLAAMRANKTAKIMAEIERKRWVVEQKPQLRLVMRADPPRVTVTFEGPVELRTVNVKLQIRSNPELYQLDLPGWRITKPYEFPRSLRIPVHMQEEWTRTEMRRYERLGVGESFTKQLRQVDGFDSIGTVLPQVPPLRLWVECTDEAWGAKRTRWKMGVELPPDVEVLTR